MTLLPALILAASLLAIPLNLLVAASVLFERRRKKRDDYFQTSFFSLLLFQLFVDPFALLLFFVVFVLRDQAPLSSLYYSWNETLFPGFSYWMLYIVLYCKIIGVILLSMQRLAAVSFPHSWLNQIMEKYPTLINLICFPFSFLLVGILWSSGGRVTFSDPVEMAYILDLDIIQRNVLIALGVISGTIVITTCVYAFIYRQMKLFALTGFTHNTASTASRRMSQQGIAQVFALVFIDVYFFIVAIVEFHEVEEVNVLRVFYHIFYFLISILNPVMLLILSPKTRVTLRNLFTMRKKPSVFVNKTTVQSIT